MTNPRRPFPRLGSPYTLPNMSVPLPSARAPSLRVITLILAAELLLTLLFQLPGVMDFQKFAFYDEGAWLHVDQLVAAGHTPTIDLSYSYGTLPLMLSRAWMTLFGRTPWTYLGFLTTCNLLAAWGLAATLHAAGLSWRRLAAACVLLPLAIMPNNYSLMHPLEMLLLLWSLAHLARGRYGIALAFATAAVLTKPSMAYVLGLILLILAFLYPNGPVNAQAQGLQSLGLRQRLRQFWPALIPPTLTALALLALSILTLGLRPALANIIPVAAGRAYKQMNFGIFHAGRDFWLYDGKGNGIRAIAHHYFFTPATFWILASLVLWILGLRALRRLAKWRAPEAARPSDPLLLTLALLHAAFVFGFYAWQGSWTYYSYLLVLGVLVGLRGRRQTLILRLLLVAAALGLTDRYSDAYGRWFGMSRSADAGGLFVYQDVLEEARQVRALARQHQGLFLVNGALPMIWPEAQTPACWFLSPGILTPQETAALQAQMDHAGAIILYKEYDQNQEAWFWPELAPQRRAFELRTWRILDWTFREKPLYESKRFLVLRRHD
jgi:hypothetical protein